MSLRLHGFHPLPFVVFSVAVPRDAPRDAIRPFAERLPGAAVPLAHANHLLHVDAGYQRYYCSRSTRRGKPRDLNRTFDDDSSLRTSRGWDDVTGVGSPNSTYYKTADR